MYKKYIKRLVDIVLSIIGLPFFLVLFVFIAPFIYITDRGHIFYNAERLGRNRKNF